MNKLKKKSHRGANHYKVKHEDKIKNNHQLDSAFYFVTSDIESTGDTLEKDSQREN